MNEFKTASGGDLCYYPLLFKALEETKGDVLELGMGHGSTPILNKYCKARKLYYFDFNKEWRDKFLNLESENHKSFLITDWDYVFNNHADASVIFIDQSPGERRKRDLELFKNTKGIVVIHDTEPTGAGDYRARPLFHLYKYVVEVQTEGAWATALSNEYDLTKWIGKFNNYNISAWQQK
jgi:hypothetical protein